MAITVEDGTIVSGADSYLSLSESDTIAEELLLDPAEWTGLSDPDKEKYLKRATKEVDLKNNWNSEIKDREQALAWPREEFKDVAGRTIKNDIVPQLVKEATLFLAYNQATEGSTFTVSPSVKSESYGDTSVEYSGVAGNSNGEADFFLRLLRQNGYSSGSSIVRVYRN